MAQNKKILLKLSGSILFLAVFFISTNPNDLHIGFLVLPLMAIGYIFYQSVSFVLRSLKIISSLKTQRLVSGAISAAAVCLLVFQSIGGLGFGEVVMLLLFCGLSIFYVVRLTKV